jgi:hypothetical protein
VAGGEGEARGQIRDGGRRWRRAAIYERLTDARSKPRGGTRGDIGLLQGVRLEHERKEEDDPERPTCGPETSAR